MWDILCTLLCFMFRMCECAKGVRSLSIVSDISITSILESHDILTGASDTCKYLSLILPNGMEAMFVQNPDAEKEILLIDIDAGSEYDKYPGTAHFLEHLLFLGTRKYPYKSDYDDFISKCGGSANASTSLSNTTYYLEMPAGLGNEILNEAVDRMSQFFISPLFLEESASDEINAVESEFQGYKKMDSRRWAQIYMSHANPDHPLNRFGTGNRETLAKEHMNVRSEVIEFYEKHYLPQNMVVVVYTPRNINRVKIVVADRFGKVGYGEVQERVPRKNDIPPYLPDAFLQILWIKSIQKHREISIKYVLPEESMDVEGKPQMYLSRLLSYREDGSLFYILREMCFISSLDPSFYYNYSYKYGAFSISIKLTEEGLQSYEEVIAMVLAYIEMLKKEPVNLRVLEETQRVQKTYFDTYTYKKADILGVMETMAENLRNIGFKRSISSKYLIEEVDEGAAMTFVEMLRDNFFITVFDPDFESHVGKNEVLREKWYGTQYMKIKYNKDEEMMQGMKNMLGSIVFPPVNEFIVTNVDVKCSERALWIGESPMLLMNEERLRLWHRVDDCFKVPEARLGFIFKGSYRLMSVQNDVMTEILCRVVNYVVTKEMYTAVHSGYTINVQRTCESENGITIDIYGFDEKIGRVVTEVMKRVAGVTFEGNVLQKIKKEYKEFLHQWEKKLPRGKAHAYWSYCLTSRTYMPLEELEYVDDITVENMQECVNDFFGSTMMETLVYGNIYLEEAWVIQQEVIDILTSRYPRRSAFEVKTERIKLPKDNRPFFYRSTPGNESCVCFYIETGVPRNRRDLFLRILFNHITKSSFFGELRVNQQLGYAVGQFLASDNFSNMIVYLVQSEWSVDTIYRRITEFIYNVGGKMIAEMSEEKLGEYKKSLKEMLIMRKGQSAEFDYMMSKILNGTYDFETRKIGVRMMERVTKNDLLNFVDEKITSQRSMCIAMVSEDRYEEELERLMDKGDRVLDLGLTFVHLDKVSIENWRSTQKEYHAPPRSVINLKIP